MRLTALPDFSSADAAAKKSRGLRGTERALPPLPTLDQFVPPDDAANYLAANQGRYVLMLETIVNEAASRGLIDTALAGTIYLTKLTELGRRKIDAKVEVRQLRDEFDLSHVSTDELKKLLSRKEEEKDAAD